MKSLSRVAIATLSIAIAVLGHAQTVQIPASKCTAVTTVTCQPTSVTLPSSPVVTPPVISQPAGVTWMYLAGTKTLAGDFSGDTTSYNHATSSGFNGAITDMLINSKAPWGCVIPYWAANYRLPNPGYTSLVLSLKPTITGDTFGIHAERVGDVGLPSIELLSYGPKTVSGQWGSYIIPLKDLGVLGDSTLYKVVLCTHTATSDSWELDAIGFQ